MVSSRISLLASLTACALLWAPCAHAEPRLPRLFGDNMVLQRDAPIVLWGWADPGEQVAVEFRDQRARTTADQHGAWSVSLAPLAAGGPDTMRVAGRRTIILNNILVGDVWLAAGQSNMEFPLRQQAGFGGVLDSEREVAQADFPRMRLFRVNKNSAFTPSEDVRSDGWQPVTPDTAASFSAIAYLFGRELHRRYEVPIGLIESSWGGTPAECWVSARGLSMFPQFAAAIGRLARIDESALEQYRRYLAERNAWYALHGREDRGRIGERDVWAAASLSDRDWPSTIEPQPWPRKAVKDFDGTMWFRRTIDLPAGAAGRPMRLHLMDLRQADTTYFNGVRVGASEGENAERDYPLPASLARPGRNLITVRITGSYESGDGYVGMLGDAADLYLSIGTQRVPLAGRWSFQAGPDLRDLPDPPPLAEFMTQFPQAPTLLYNGMIAPLVRYRIRGSIWYQGEANAARPGEYRTLFPALIGEWRSRWGYEFPFLFVQLAGFGRNQPQPADYDWAQMRESQAAALALPRTGMAVAIDLGDASDIHPKNKQAVAHRLALVAEHIAYGENVLDSGPRYRSMRREGNRLRLLFDQVGSGLVMRDPQSAGRGFAIAGADRRFHWAQARLDGTDVLVHSAQVSAPLAVRYDWGNTPDGNLYNREGLPAAPFRAELPPPRD
jgi:sialate O-acetylesterase